MNNKEGYHSEWHNQLICNPYSDGGTHMTLHTSIGRINITDQVISKIAGTAAKATDGIVSMTAGLVDGAVKHLSGKRMMKGIQVKISDAMVSVELRIIVQHGLKIHEVCHGLQRNVREAIEQLSGLTVAEVHVRVEGLSLS